VQGQLREELVSLNIESRCAQRRTPIRLLVDSALNYHVEQGDANLLVFEPDIDWSTFAEPTIINAY
jgi:hypothetical protein